MKIGGGKLMLRLYILDLVVDFAVRLERHLNRLVQHADQEGLLFFRALCNYSNSADYSVP